MRFDPVREYRFELQSIEDLESLVLKQATQVGLFFQPVRSQLSAGDRVWVRVKLRANQEDLYLGGVVVWHRMKQAGAANPPGTFVSLGDGQADTLERVLRYLRQGGRNNNRRSHPRYPLVMESRYLTDQGEFGGETRSLSRTGAYQVVHGPLLPLKTTFPFALLPEGIDGPRLMLEASVAWINPQGELKGMGLQISGSRTEKKAWERLISEFESEIVAK